MICSARSVMEDGKKSRAAIRAQKNREKAKRELRMYKALYEYVLGEDVEMLLNFLAKYQAQTVTEEEESAIAEAVQDFDTFYLK